MKTLTLNYSIAKLKPSTVGNYLKIKLLMSLMLIFTKTVLNIFHNFIPDKNIICNYKDHPLFNNQVKH